MLKIERAQDRDYHYEAIFRPACVNILGYFVIVCVFNFAFLIGFAGEINPM